MKAKEGPAKRLSQRESRRAADRPAFRAWTTVRRRRGERSVNRSESRPPRLAGDPRLLVAAPFIGLYPVFMMKALCYAIFACAFNLLLGYTGLLSFGHAAYLGLAAYVTGWLVRTAGWSPELGVLAGTLLAGLLGLAVGLIAIRRQGIYFAMITLAMAQMIYFVFLQAPFTGGEDGLQGVPRGTAVRPHPAGERPDAVLRRAGGVRGGVPVHHPRRAFAVRPGAEGDPRERAARGLAGLRRRPLQAAGLRAVDRARRPGRAR